MYLFLNTNFEKILPYDFQIINGVYGPWIIEDDHRLYEYSQSLSASEDFVDGWIIEGHPSIYSWISHIVENLICLSATCYATLSDCSRLRLRNPPKSRSVFFGCTRLSRDWYNRGVSFLGVVEARVPNPGWDGRDCERSSPRASYLFTDTLRPSLVPLGPGRPCSGTSDFEMVVSSFGNGKIYQD